MKKVLSIMLAVLVLAATLSVAVSAVWPSPSTDDYYVVTAKSADDKAGSAIADPASVLKGETTTLTATENDGYKFTGWTFTGEFEWVSGDANSKVIVIRPLSDVVFTANYSGSGNGNTNPISPVTGNNNTAVTVVVAAIVVLSAAAVAVTGKKYFSAK